MKRKLVALLPMSILLLSACGSGDEVSEPVQTQASQEEQISNFTKEYVEESFNSSSKAAANLSQAGNESIAIIGSKNSEALTQSSNAIKKLSSLEDTQLDSISKIYQNYNPMTEYYDYKDTSKVESATTSIWNLAIAAMYSSERDQILEVTVPSESIELRGDDATVKLSDVTYTTNTREDIKLPILNSGAPQEVYVCKTDDGSWKIDAKEEYQNLQVVKDQKKKDANSSKKPSPKKEKKESPAAKK